MIYDTLNRNLNSGRQKHAQFFFLVPLQQRITFKMRERQMRIDTPMKTVGKGVYA